MRKHMISIILFVILFANIGYSQWSPIGISIFGPGGYLQIPGDDWSVYGINVGVLSSYDEMYGISVDFLANVYGDQAGINISGIFSYSDFSSGITISPIIISGKAVGVNMGGYLRLMEFSGIMMGFINNAEVKAGVQIGLRNYNIKSTSLPLPGFYPFVRSLNIDEERLEMKFLIQIGIINFNLSTNR